MLYRTVFLACALGLAATPAAYAQAASDQGPVTTSGASTAASTTDELIAEALHDQGSPDQPPDQGGGVASPVDKAIHGEVGVGVGSGGYREAYGVATAPLGQHSTATVAVDDTQFGGRGHNFQSRSLAISLAFGVNGAPPPPTDLCGPALIDGRYAEPQWTTLTRRDLRAAGGPCAEPLPGDPQPLR